MCNKTVLPKCIFLLLSTRPVCGAVEAPCGQLSNTLSDVINAMTKFEDKFKSECRSSEELRAEIKKVNIELNIERRVAQRLENQGDEGGEDRRTSNMVSEGGTEANQEEESGEQVPAWQLENQRVVGSTDFKSYYPSLPIDRTAQMLKLSIR